MTYFWTYLSLGFQHILNWQAMDHLLFILAITCIFTWADIKQILWLVTAFTLGHSVTLALATIGWISVNPEWIEFLIPCTIFLSAIQNLNFKDNKKRTPSKTPYYTVLFFGLIHGLGFSNYLKSLLGKEASLLGPLFSFNIGLEIGQILIVMVILALSYCIVSILKIPRKMYVRYGSILAISLSLRMIIERLASL